MLEYFDKHCHLLNSYTFSLPMAHSFLDSRIYQAFEASLKHLENSVATIPYH